MLFCFVSACWHWKRSTFCLHYSDIIMSVMASQINSISIIYSIVCWGADQRKHQSSASLAFVRGIHQWSVDSPHKGPVTLKMFPFDDVIMFMCWSCIYKHPRLVHHCACWWTSTNGASPSAGTVITTKSFILYSKHKFEIYLYLPYFFFKIKMLIYITIH